MRKITLLFMAVVLLLSACNLPSKRASEAGAQSGLATAVAQTLEVLPTITLPATATQAPTAAATATIEQTTTNTPTAPTETYTPGPSQTPSDFKTSLGTPLLKDTLDKGNGFGLVSPYKDDYSSFSVANGVLTAKSFMTNGWHSWRLRPPKIQDFYLEGKFNVDSCASRDTYGLIIRAPDYESGQGYYLGFTCDGHYDFGRWDATKNIFLVNSSTSNFINSGTGQTNRIGIMAKGNTFTLYANDQVLQEITDDGIMGSGYFGLFVGSNSGALTVDLDEIAYWNPK